MNSGLASPPALLILDCDGVLVDSEVLANQVFLEALRGLGLDLQLADLFERFVGRTMADCLRQVEAMLGRPVPEGFLAQLDARTFEAFERGLKAVPGVVSLLDRLDQARVPYCVASSGSHAKMRKTLGLTGLWDRLEGRIYSATDVPRSKPFPDIYLHAAAAMRTEPGRCVVVEDSATGVRAGIAAGMRVFGYAAMTEAARLEAAGATVFTDMAQLPGLLGLPPPR